MTKKWFLAALLVATPAAAHDWYPHECCHDQDCAAVDKIEMVPQKTSDGAGSTPVMAVTTKWGTALVPASFPRRKSQDHRMHACMLPDGRGKMRLLCLFMPPSM